MDQISNEKFGLFVTELRKKKNLTQKDLAEKLYVSDKTVSKWERGLSMPNVVLLIPIADILDVTVTELLRGEKIDTQKNIDTKEVEELVVGSLDMAVRNSIHQHRKNWILAYLLCFLISITEIIMLVVSGNSIAEMKDDILLVTGLMLLFGAWFCFFHPVMDHFFLHLIVEQMILCKNHVISDYFQCFCNYRNRLFYSFSQFCYFCF